MWKRSSPRFHISHPRSASGVSGREQSDKVRSKSKFFWLYCNRVGVRSPRVGLVAHRLFISAPKLTVFLHPFQRGVQRVYCCQNFPLAIKALHPKCHNGRD
jgi:hypothetical protein